MNVTEIKQAIINEDLTEEQLRAVDADAVRKRFPKEQMTGVFVKKVLRCLQNHLDKLEDDINSKEVMKAIDMFAKKNPLTEHKMYRRGKKRYVLICLDGLDNEDDE